MSLMGVDIGSSGVKATVFSIRGDEISIAYREYQHYYDNPGWIELNPIEVWDSMVSCILECNRICKNDPVTAISVSAIGDAFTLVEENGNYLSRTVLCADNRAQNECMNIQNALGGMMNIKRKTGAVCNPKHPASKFLWFYNHRNEDFKDTWKFLGWIELIAYKMGLMPAIDSSNAAKTMMYNLESKTWDIDMLSVTHVSDDKMPQIIPAGTVLGLISTDIAKELGFTVPVKFVQGTFDQACVALGAGAISSSMASLGLGTVASMTVVFDEESAKNFNMNNKVYPIIPHVYPEKYITCATILSGGLILKWFRDQFSKFDIDQAKKHNIDPYDLMLEGLPNSPGSILMLPHFAGAGAPWNDPSARGCIFGLTVQHTAKDIIKAILESIAYEIKHNIELIEELGTPLESLIISGGGARSVAWMQIIADITGKKIIPVDADEVGCCGAAIIAGAGSGIFSSFEEGIKKFVKYGMTIVPNIEKNSLYMDRYKIFKKIYTQTKGISHSIVSLYEY